MKTITIDGQNVVVFVIRGKGDGVAGVRYLVDEGDGTYSEVGHGYSDPIIAEKVYADPGADHVRWNIAEARRQTVPPDRRSAQKPFVEPTAIIVARTAVKE